LLRNPRARWPRSLQQRKLPLSFDSSFELPQWWAMQSFETVHIHAVNLSYVNYPT
jgi:hypothetical protein